MKVMTDFNAQGGDGTVLVLREHFDEGPFLDQRVLVADHDGNEAEGIVVRIRGGLAYVKIDWDTWSSAEDDEWSV